MGDAYDLDQEVLAALTGPKDGGSGDDSASGDDFDADGSGDDFDDSASESASDDDDDMDDDDAEVLHPDDPDFDVKKKTVKKAAAKRPKKPPAPKKPKKKIEKTRAAPSKKRKPPAKGKRAAEVVSDDGDAEEDFFRHDFDEQGFGDAVDKEEVLGMNEIERETLLAERVDARQQAERLWVMTRDMQRANARKGARTSSRAKPGKSKTDAALKALKTDKAAKKVSASGRAAIADMSDDSDVDSDKNRRRGGDSDVDDGDDDDFDDAGDRHKKSDEDAVMVYKDLVIANPRDDDDPHVVSTRLMLPRDVLAVLVVEPYFDRAVKGLFVRYRREMKGNDPAYILCSVGSVSTERIDRAYVLTNHKGEKVRTNKYLTLMIGSDTMKECRMSQVSNSAPTMFEFETYSKRLVASDSNLIGRDDLNKLKKHAERMTSTTAKRPTPSKSELDAHVANQELLFPEKINWTQRKGMVTDEVAICQQNYDLALQSNGASREAVPTLKAKLDEKLEALKDIEANLLPAKVSKSQKLFSNMARRNEVLNTENEKLAASKLAMETNAEGENPFARFDTTGVSYFSIKGQNGKDGDEAGTPRVSMAELRSRTLRMARSGGGDWKLSLGTWNADGEKRAISSAPVHPAFAGRFHGLEDFDIPVEDLERRTAENSFCPPAIDALYAHQVGMDDESDALADGKAITIEDYSSRTG